jgi:hypothetical protein
MQVNCAGCDRELGDTRGTATDYARCTEFQLVGACPDCKLITETKSRVYDDWRILHLRDDRWVEIAIR